MATAARLQARGLRTIVLEAHGLPGGCAGYYKRKGFAFDVGATTLVDFAPGGARAAQAIGPSKLHLVRYARWTVGDALRAHGLSDDVPLVGLLSMLIEDTVHSTVERAPLLNAALGVTIRGAGLSRARGGMRG